MSGTDGEGRVNVGGQPRKASVLFVCLGNICRSPTAEAVFRERAARAGLDRLIDVDSAGTGNWHVGEPPDHRAIEFAARRGYDLAPLRARQVSRGDFDRFRWILAMDQKNLRDLKALRPPRYDGHLGLVLDFAPSLGVREVPDPYFGGLAGFDHVLDLLEHASEKLLEQVGRGLR